jgi:beta-galactosidase/beta-glucuronidase
MEGGVGCYRRAFTVPADRRDKKVFVNFDRAYMNSQVWINGHSLGIRPYGDISFEYDLTPCLVFGGSLEDSSSRVPTLLRWIDSSRPIEATVCNPQAAIWASLRGYWCSLRR